MSRARKVPKTSSRTAARRRTKRYLQHPTPRSADIAHAGRRRHPKQVNRGTEHRRGVEQDAARNEMSSDHLGLRAAATASRGTMMALTTPPRAQMSLFTCRNNSVSEIGKNRRQTFRRAQAGNLIPHRCCGRTLRKSCSTNTMPITASTRRLSISNISSRVADTAPEYSVTARTTPQTRQAPRRSPQRLHTFASKRAAMTAQTTRRYEPLQDIRWQQEDPAAQPNKPPLPPMLRMSGWPLRAACPAVVRASSSPKAGIKKETPLRQRRSLMSRSILPSVAFLLCD